MSYDVKFYGADGVMHWDMITLDEGEAFDLPTGARKAEIMEHYAPGSPFDQNHHRYHTPNGPNPLCGNCKWLNWSQPEDRL